MVCSTFYLLSSIVGLPSAPAALSAPREDGRMAPTGSLTFNDAPWLSTGLLNKEAVQFVHGSIDADFGTCVSEGK